MPNYIGYSPWTDAAEVGKGIGDVLGAVLFKLPLLRAEERRKNRELDIQERHYGAMEGLYAGREKLLGTQSQQAPLLLALKQAKANLDTQRYQSQIGLNEAKISDMEGKREDLRTYRGGQLGLGERNAKTREANATTQRGLLRQNQRAEGRLYGGELYPNLEGEGYERIPAPEAPAEEPAKPGVMKRLGDAAAGFFSRQGDTMNEWDSSPSLVPQSSPYKFNLTGSGDQPDLVPPEALDMMETDFGPVEPPQRFRSTNMPAASGARMRQNGRDVPPTPTHNIQVQDPGTGAYYWTDELGVRRNPNFKVIQRF